MSEAYVRPAAILLHSVTRHKTLNGLQSCPAAFMAACGYASAGVPHELLHMPNAQFYSMPSNFPMPNNCPMPNIAQCPDIDQHMQASFGSNPMPKADIIVSTFLSLPLEHRWLGVSLS